MRLFHNASTKLINPVKTDRLISLKLAQSTRDSGGAVSAMASVSKRGQMVPNTRASGEKTAHMAKVNLYMSMAMFMTASGQMIKQMAREYTSM